jgi:hypothetical protein
MRAALDQLMQIFDFLEEVLDIDKRTTLHPVEDYGFPSRATVIVHATAPSFDEDEMVATLLSAPRVASGVWSAKGESRRSSNWEFAGLPMKFTPPTPL